MSKAIVLLSGGQDSTTILFWAMEKFDEVHALNLDYGQRHSREVQAARNVAAVAGVDLTELSLPLGDVIQSDLIQGSGDFTTDVETGLPTSFVPGRNILLATLAMAWGYHRGFDNLVLGVSEEDYSGYPDCREKTIKSVEETLRLGLDRPGLKVHAPLVHMSKKDEVLLARSLVGCWDALAYSWTCYKGGGAPCGTCPSCELRAKGFKEAGLDDPAL